MMLTITLIVVQIAIGIAIVIGGAVLAHLGLDRRSRFIHRLQLTGLVAWGIWFIWEALDGRHDSPPALAFAALVAAVLLRNGRQIRGILDGEPWWPKHHPAPKTIGGRK